jgi:ATP-binding cassette subfamily F protein 2
MKSAPVETKTADVKEVKEEKFKIEEPIFPAEWLEQFAATDFTDRMAIIKLFPQYVQEQWAIKLVSKKPLVKSVNIESYTLKTPFGDRTLLKSTELVLEAGKRQGLVGANSTGKTLLFTQMSSGAIKEFPKHLHVHHCKELENHELSQSVLGTVVNCNPFRNQLIKIEAKLKELIAATTATGTRGSYKDNLEFIQMNMISIRAQDGEERASKMLRVLGFDDRGQSMLCKALSGGLRMRVALCMAFFMEADLLLLDEPTNHLDFPSVLWLENRLRGYKSSFLMVSHDRELLNNVCTSVLLIEDQQIHYYNMGFKEFEKKKAAEDKKKYEEVEKFLAKNRNADPSTPLGKLKYEKKEWSDKYQAAMVAMAGKFTFPTSTPLENTEVDEKGQPLAPEEIKIINLQKVRFSYDPSAKNPVFIFNDPIDFCVKASTRVGVMGPNGAGKSTLLKLLTHKLKPTDGTVTHHPNFTLAYFGQHSTAELDLELTAAEFMAREFPKISSGLLRSHLAKTSIVGTVQDTRMQRLSYSQRSCIIFSKLTFVCPHLLIMDEPTNFLDLESVDSLISACNKYKGALLLVSHNRDFLKKCAKQYLSVVPGRFEMYNELKAAEKATYTFIAEMEEGTKIGASALANNPGGGSVHSSQKVGGGQAEEKKLEKGVISSKPTAKPVAKPAAAAKPAETKTAPAQAKKEPEEHKETKTSTPASKVSAAPAAKAASGAYKVGDKVTALWKDGKWYDALIKGVKGEKYDVVYTSYGNKATLATTHIKAAAAK